MMRVRPYIFFIQNTTTGGCLYVDASGNIQEISILAAGTALDCSMKNAPDGWMEATLGYSRNKKYYGFNRSYSDPLKLVKDAAFIARTKFYLETGVNTKLSLLILKYNSQPAAGEPTYKLYHKGPIDFPQKNDKVAEGFSCNLLEGGILQLLKTYENTIFSIPCDGSIPENIKVNMDGMYFQDTFNYQILPGIIPHPGSVPFSSYRVLPTVFLSNDGDNIGVIHNDTSMDVGPDNYIDLPAFLETSPNFNFTSVRPVIRGVKIKGHINVAPVDQDAAFGFSFFTNKSTTLPGFLSTHAGSMLTQQNGNIPGYVPDDNYQVNLFSAQTIYFEKTIFLDAGENLFLMPWSASGPNHLVSIIGGSYTMEFASIAADTAPWCMTWYDLFRLLIRQINKVAGTQFQTFSYGADSAFLQQNLNLTVTSGDAIRASGDPNYQKFYNAIQANPNFPNLNLFNSFGPVIKTSLSDAFTSFNAILNGSLGNQTLPGEGETVFFEPKGYVFDSSKDTFDLGEVSDFEVSLDMEKLFTILRIGYPEQQYDQKSGKYEWNTTLEMVNPFNPGPSKTWEIISRYRADAYGIERLRANIDSTSHTKNTSDNSVFIINTDRSKFIYDYFEMGFISAVQDVTIPNTNYKLIQSYLNQGLNMSVLRAGYMSVNNDPSILVLSENGLSASKTLAINIAGFLNGNPANLLTGTPADTVTIKLFVNGIVQKTYLITSVSAATPIIISDSLTRVWNLNDAIYMQVTTTSNGNAILDSVDLNMASGYFDASGANINIEGGAANRMIALPTINAPHVGGFPGTPVLSYGFQYLQFNSVLANENFDATFTFAGQVNGTSSPGIQVDLRVFSAEDPATNVSDTYALNTSGGWQPFGGFFTFNRDWELGDIMYVLGSNYSNLTTEFQSLDIQLNSTAIKAYALKRVQYDSISGIPNLCGYVTVGGVATAQPITTGPGAPYNIEDINPKQMLLNWGNYISSILWDPQSQAGQLLFSTLTKNQYLQTVLNGKTLVQNANVRIGDLDKALFTLNKAKFKTRVPLNFDDIMRSTTNAFLKGTFFGQPFYGFAEDMKQKATLNEMQSWEVLLV